MNKEKKATALFEHIKKGSHLEQCPVLYSWFEPKLEEASKIPVRPSREGINPEDPKPMSRYKQMMMLFQIVYPKLSLKKYAETCEISYGTVRNWNIETEYNAQQEQLRKEYLDLFFSRLKKSIGGSGRIKNAIIQLNETKHYQNIFLLVGINTRFQMILTDISKSKAGYRIIYKEAYRHFLVSILNEGVFEDHQALRKVLESYYDAEKLNVEKMLKRLLKDLNDGDVERATVTTKLVKSLFLPHMKDLKHFVLAHHDLKYGKRKRIRK